MKPVIIESDNWSASPAVEARTFSDRLRGVRAVEPDTALVLRLRSIHTVGLKRPITVVAVGQNDCVEHVDEVAPNKFARFATAQYLIELPSGAPTPRIGDRVSVADA